MHFYNITFNVISINYGIFFVISITFELIFPYIILFIILKFP